MKGWESRTKDGGFFHPEHPTPDVAGLIAQQLHWVDREPFTGTLRCTVVKPATARPILFRARLTRWMTIVVEVILIYFAAAAAGPVRRLYSGEARPGRRTVEQRLPLTVCWIIQYTTLIQVASKRLKKMKRFLHFYLDTRCQYSGKELLATSPSRRLRQLARPARLRQQLAHRGHLVMPTRCTFHSTVSLDMNPSSTSACSGGSEANSASWFGNTARRAECQQLAKRSPN